MSRFKRRVRKIARNQRKNEELLEQMWVGASRPIPLLATGSITYFNLADLNAGSGNPFPGVSSFFRQAHVVQTALDMFEGPSETKTRETLDIRLAHIRSAYSLKADATSPSTSGKSFLSRARPVCTG